MLADDRRTRSRLRPDSDASRLDDFAAATNGWFWETDREHRFIYMSASVQDVTGVPPEWHYGRTREELGSPKGVTRAEWAEHLRTIREHRPFENFAYQRIGPDRVQWLRTSGRPVFSEAGAFLGYRGVATDVTAEMVARERVRALSRAVRDRESQEQQLTQAVETLTTANQRQRELSLILAHDLKGPLASVHDSLSALLDSGEVAGNSRAAEYLRMGVDVLERMIDKVSDTIDDAIRTETFDELVDLNAAVASALADIGLAPGDDAIRVHVDPMPKILGNASEFRAVFFNLFANSLKYRSADRPLAIDIKSRFSTNDTVCIEVRDNGQGVRPEDVDHIFDQGYRAERHKSVPGTGRGLAFVRSAIARMGGEVMAESDLDERTTIYLEVPAPRT